MFGYSTNVVGSCLVCIVELEDLNLKTILILSNGGTIHWNEKVQKWSSKVTEEF